MYSRIKFIKLHGTQQKLLLQYPAAPTIFEAYGSGLINLLFPKTKKKILLYVGQRWTLNKYNVHAVI